MGSTPERTRRGASRHDTPHARAEVRAVDPRARHLLALQRAAGNRAVAQRVDEEIAEDDYAARAERKLRDNDLYADHDHVRAAVRAQLGDGDDPDAASRLAQRIELLDDAAFEERLSDYSNGVDPHTGEQWTDEDIGEVRGYVERSGDSGSIMVVRAGDEADRMLHTALHEGMHMISDAEWRSGTPWQLNEGATEHFTREVGRSHDFDTDWSYERELATTERLESAVDQDPIVGGYFAGDLRGLRQAINAVGREAGRTIVHRPLFSDWEDAMRAGDLDEADRLLEEPGPPSTDRDEDVDAD